MHSVLICIYTLINRNYDKVAYSVRYWFTCYCRIAGWVGRACSAALRWCWEQECRGSWVARSSIWTGPGQG